MKTLFTLILLLITAADFSAISFDIEIDSSISVSDCDEMNHHKDNSSKEPMSCEDHKCECHIGHAHTAIIYQTTNNDSVNVKLISKIYPVYSQLDLSSYYTKINRPPIS
jgi:hypothetical protein